MVIVDSEFRGRGIGTALLERAIEYLDSQNIPCMKLDATPQGRILYEKLGFVSEYDIERWMLKREPARDDGVVYRPANATAIVLEGRLRMCCGLIGKFSGLTGAVSCVP